MMSKNSIVPFLKDYLIKFLTHLFLVDTSDGHHIFILFLVGYILIFFYMNDRPGQQQ